MGMTEFTRDIGETFNRAAQICRGLVEDGYSVLLLGVPGSGKTPVAKMADAQLPEHLRGRIAPWNSPGSHLPPETGNIAYLEMLTFPRGVVLHSQLPPIETEIFWRFVHSGWLPPGRPTTR